MVPNHKSDVFLVKCGSRVELSHPLFKFERAFAVESVLDQSGNLQCSWKSKSWGDRQRGGYSSRVSCMTTPSLQE